MNDKTFKLRLPAEELEAWREKAKREGKALAEWVRTRCSGTSLDSQTVLKAVPTRRHDSDSGSSTKPVGKTCKHGIGKGWRCWQCGGLAVIDAM